MSYARSAKGLLTPPDTAVKRGQRFMRRRAAWRAGPQRLVSRHAGIEAHAPLVLAHLFDRALADVGATRSYIMQAAETAETVRLNGETWHWFTGGGTADGRGLYELAAWRWDVPVYDAAIAIWHIVKEKTR